MSTKYIPSSKAKHPALSSREKLLQAMERYDKKPALAAKSIGCSSEAIMDAMHRLAPDKVAEWKKEGMLTAAWSQSL